MGDCTIRVEKTKALISFVVTVKLIWVFVFAYADCLFSHAVRGSFYVLDSWTFYSYFDVVDIKTKALVNMLAKKEKVKCVKLNDIDSSFMVFQVFC